MLVALIRGSFEVDNEIFDHAVTDPHNGVAPVSRADTQPNGQLLEFEYITAAPGENKAIRSIMGLQVFPGCISKVACDLANSSCSISKSECCNGHGDAIAEIESSKTLIINPSTRTEASKSTQ